MRRGTAWSSCLDQGRAIAEWATERTDPGILPDRAGGVLALAAAVLTRPASGPALSLGAPTAHPGWPAPPGPDADLGTALDRFAALDAETFPARVGSPLGVLRARDWLAWVELHLVCLADAEAPGDPPVVRTALAGTARTLCAILAERHPGRSIELRVPPFAATQLGLGAAGRHTRGTPPTVVELDAATLLRLATGRLAWQQALGSHAVRASGTRSDLSGIWPIGPHSPE